jgi:hypothetical protein
MDYEFSKKPATDAFDISTPLAQLGLSQYEERLQENGFEDWGTLTAITETDMAKMNFKRGHRRKLQQAIRKYRSASPSHTVYWGKNFSLPSERLPTVSQQWEMMPQPSQQAARTTRQYRQHPRPDRNASHKPQTAYALFSEHVRQDLALSHLSFSETAKETAKRWRELSHEKRMLIRGTSADDGLQNYKKVLERVLKETWSYPKSPSIP